MLPISSEGKKQRKTKGYEHGAKDESAESALLYAPHASRYDAKTTHAVEKSARVRTWRHSLLFEWFSPLMALGNTRHLQTTDLFSLRDAHNSVEIAPQLSSVWADERTRKGKRASLLLALMRAFGWRFVLLVVVKGVYDSLTIVLPPLLLKAIIEYSEDPSASIIRGLCYALAVAVSGFLVALLHRHFDYFAAELALFVHSSVSTAVLKHTLVVSPSVLQRIASDEIIGYATTDSSRLQHGVQTLFCLVGVAVQIMSGGLLLFSLVGHAAWAGLVAAVVGLACSGVIEKLVPTYEVAITEAKSERLHLSQELVTAIKPLKLLAWETNFVERIVDLRSDELCHLKTLLLALGFSSTLAVMAPVLVATATLLVYPFASGGSIDGSTILPTLLLLLLLQREPFGLLAKRGLALRDSYVSLSKVNAFLVEPVRVLAYEPHPSTGVSVVVKNADFKWDTSTTAKTELDLLLEAQGIVEKPAVADPVLHHVNFYASPGELHVVVGAAKSGKSSFLAGIVGLVRCSAGEVTVHGRVAYITCDPSMLHASIRDNICFGQPYEAERYLRALKASHLKCDWPSLPQGDQTIVASDRGASLTASQRTRVALARSVYQNADVYVFDDILSTMDRAVAKKIIKQCMQTALKDKIVIMATQSLTFAKRATNVVVLARGTIAEAGNFNSLMANKKWGLLPELTHSKSTKKSVKAVSEVAATEVESSNEAEIGSDGDEDVLLRAKLAEFAPVIGENTPEVLAPTDDDVAGENVSTAVLLWFMRALGEKGYVVFGAVVMLSLSAALFEFFSIYSIAQAGLPRVSLIKTFTAFGVLVVLSTMASTVIMHFGSLHACQDIHQKLLRRLSRAPTAFYDETPINRVVARVSKDLSIVDAGLAFTWPRLCTSSAQLIVTMGVLMTLLSPWLIVVLALLILGVHRLEESFGRPTRDLERIYQATTPPIKSSIAEVLRGMPAIRMHKADHLFLRHFYDRLDTHHQAFLFKVCANNWLGIRVDALYVGVMSCASLAILHVRESTEAGLADAQRAGQVGVALFFAFALSPVLFEFIKAWNGTRFMLLAGGRIKTDSKMPVEAATESLPQLRPIQDWPSVGAIEFDNVSLRYRPGLPRILRSINFTVSGGSTIAILGNSGSGRKSILAALTRLVELATGTISIDGVDISKIGLHDLRSKIAVLSPDSIFFVGTIRSNLDSTRQFTDEEIWGVIRTVQLQGTVLSLDEVVNERGANYSDGERHLLSLARTMLRRPKILLIDEGDAAVVRSTETDVFDQCVQQAFAGATKLIITQRTAIATAATTVLVLVNGQIAEWGTPKELQKNRRSLFRSTLDHWKQRDRSNRKKP